MPRPSSAISSSTESPTPDSAQGQRALGGLAGCQALGRRFEAVADGVAHQVEDGIHHALDQVLVDLGLLPAQLEPHAASRSRARGRGRRTACAGRSPARARAARGSRLRADPAAAVRSDSRSPGSPATPGRHVALDAASASSSRARLITRSPIMRISSSRRASSTRTTCHGASGNEPRNRAPAASAERPRVDAAAAEDARPDQGRRSLDRDAVGARHSAIVARRGRRRRGTRTRCLSAAPWAWRRRSCPRRAAGRAR